METGHHVGSEARRTCLRAVRQCSVWGGWRKRAGLAAMRCVFVVRDVSGGRREVERNDLLASLHVYPDARKQSPALS